MRILSLVANLILIVVSADAEPLRLGHLTDLTGIGAMLGVQTSFGISMAVNEFRANGAEIEIFTADHKLKLSDVATETNRMLEVDHVDAVISDLTNPSLAAAPLVAKAGKFFFAIAPSNKVVESSTASFRSFMDYRDGCELLARQFGSRHDSTAFLGVLSEFADLCLEGVKPYLQPVAMERFDTGDDFRGSMLRLRAAGTRQIIFIGFEQDMLTAIRRASEIGLNATFGFPSLYLTPMIKKTIGKSLKGSEVFAFPSMDEEFMRKVLALDPARDLTNIEFAALAYMHTYQIIDAARNCQDRSAQCLAQAFETAAGPRLLGFRGWKNRLAQFDMTLLSWDGESLVVRQGK